MLCLTSARFNMEADVLRAVGEPDENAPSGTWVIHQDPESGEILRDWQKGATDQGTPSDDSDDLESFACIARGIADGGIRVSGTTERFGTLYDGIDYVMIQFPASVVISRRDRVTNIRDKYGDIIWIEEERGDHAPTVFSVNGVIPVIDPFGRHIENTALLERISTQ